MAITNFTVHYDDLHNDISDTSGDIGTAPGIGEVRFTPQIRPGARALAADYSPRPAGIGFRVFKGYLDADGRLKNKAGGTPGVRLWANDPALNLTRLPYKVSATLTDAEGNPVAFDDFVFDAPDEDTEVNLVSVMRVAAATASGIARGPRGYPVDDVQLDGTDLVSYVVGEEVGRVNIADLLFTPDRSVVYASNHGMSTAATGSANKEALESAIAAAEVYGAAVQIDPGTFPIAGSVYPGVVEVFGAGRYSSILEDTTKPSPVFILDEPNGHIHGIGFKGAGLDMAGLTKLAYQDYCGVRIMPGAHGSRVYDLYGEDIYIVVRLGGEHNDGGMALEQDPIEDLFIDRIDAKNVWSAVFGGTFKNMYLGGVTGTYKKATRSSGSSPDVGPPPHLVYLYSPDLRNDDGNGTWTSAYRNVGLTLGPGMMARGCADTEGGYAAFAFKYIDGITGSVAADNCPGILDLIGVQDSVINIVATNDRYPLSGTESARAAVAPKNCRRVTVRGKLTKKASSDGRAVFTESTALDCVIAVDVIANHTSGDDLSSSRGDVRIAGYRNTFEGLVRNEGTSAWYSGITVVGTGAQAIIRPDGSGGKYRRTIRVANNHQGATIEYDPAKIQPDGTVASATGISVESGAIVRYTNKRAGQTDPAGLVDTWKGRLPGQPLAVSDDGKVYTGIVTASGTAVLDSNGLRYNGVTGAAYWIADCGTENYTATLTIGNAGAKLDGFLIGYTDVNNWVWVRQRIDGSNLYWVIQTCVAGSTSNIGTNRNSITSADNDVLVVTRTGTTVAITVNGSPLYSANPTIVSLSGMTKVGLRLGAAGSGNDGATFESLAVIPA